MPGRDTEAADVLDVESPYAAEDERSLEANDAFEDERSLGADDADDASDVREAMEPREEGQKTDGAPEAEEGEDGYDGYEEVVTDESPEPMPERPLVPEVNRPHEPMVRGDAAREDAPHHVTTQAEKRHLVHRQVRAQRAWHLSEPISVERWQSAPHLRSGFSSG